VTSIHVTSSVEVPTCLVAHQLIHVVGKIVTWLEVVQRDCQVRGLCKDDAMGRGRWRKMIRMVDEEEGCEWMDVSSGTGLRVCVCV